MEFTEVLSLRKPFLDASGCSRCSLCNYNEGAYLMKYAFFKKRERASLLGLNCSSEGDEGHNNYRV